MKQLNIDEIIFIDLENYYFINNIRKFGINFKRYVLIMGGRIKIKEINFDDNQIQRALTINLDK